jgi:multiple sugar transport system substrate-binding protein
MTLRKTVGTVAVATALLAPLAACSSPSGGGSPAASTGTVVYWHAYSDDSPETKTLNEKVIPAFEKDHPEIKVKAVAFPYDQLRQKILTSTVGGDLPCLIRTDIVWVSEFAKRGMLEQLDTQLNDFSQLTANTYPGALATNKYRDHYYGLPLDTNTRVLMYNTQALQAAGVSTPPATFDEMRQLADKLKGKNVFAFADDGTKGWNLLPWIWSNGGSMLSPELDKATGYLNSPASVQAVQFLADLHTAGAIPDLMVNKTGGVETSEGLPKGQYATITDGPWMFEVFAKQYPDFKPQTAKVPAGKGGSISVIGGEDLTMTKSCASKGAAASFARHLMSPDAQLTMAKAGQMPVLSNLGSKLTDIAPYYGIFVDQLATARPRPPVPDYTKIEDLMATEVQKALRGEQSVQTALDGAAKQIDAVLGKG